MKRLVLAGLVALTAFGAIQASAPRVEAQPTDCSAVLCLTCPEGFVLSPTPGNCCRCIKA
jgi:hypothetical protein